MIGKKGRCYHVDGGLPSSCTSLLMSGHSSSINAVDSCESYCTCQSSCIGWQYSTKYYARQNHHIHCVLFISDSTCPSGFSYSSGDNSAETKKDLVMVVDNNGDNGWYCYGKNEKNNGEKLWNLNNEL